MVGVPLYWRGTHHLFTPTFFVMLLTPLYVLGNHRYNAVRYGRLPISGILYMSSFSKKKVGATALALSMLTGAVGANAADITPKNPTPPGTCLKSAYQPDLGCPDWADEFNGTELNKDFWNVYDGYSEVNQDPYGRYTKNAVSVKDGQLHLTTKVGANGQKGESAEITTNNKVAFENGYWEFKVSSYTGYSHSGAYLYGNGNVAGAQKGEVDGFEAFGATDFNTRNASGKKEKFDQSNKNQTVIHYSQDAIDAQTGKKVTHSKGGWHVNKPVGEPVVVGILKTNDGIKIFRDGVLVEEMKSSDPNYAKSFPAGQPLNTTLTARVSNVYWGLQSNPTGGISFDYVRHYPLVTATPEPTPEPTVAKPTEAPKPTETPAPTPTTATVTPTATPTTEAPKPIETATPTPVATTSPTAEAPVPSPTVSATPSEAPKVEVTPTPEPSKETEAPAPVAPPVVTPTATPEPTKPAMPTPDVPQPSTTPKDEVPSPSPSSSVTTPAVESAPTATATAPSGKGEPTATAKSSPEPTVQASSSPSETAGTPEATGEVTESPAPTDTPSTAPTESPVATTPTDDSTKPLQPTGKPKVVAPTGHDEVAGKNGFLIAVTAFAASILVWLTAHVFFGKGDRSS